MIRSTRVFFALLLASDARHPVIAFAGEVQQGRAEGSKQSKRNMLLDLRSCLLGHNLVLCVLLFKR
jgi:hypothetical protein